MVKTGRRASEEVYLYNLCVPAVKIGLTRIRGFLRCESCRLGSKDLSISNGRGMMGIEVVVASRFGMFS